MPAGDPTASPLVALGVTASVGSVDGMLLGSGFGALTGGGLYLLLVQSVSHLGAVLHKTVRDGFDIDTARLVLLLAARPAAALSDRIGRSR